jgi:hypothetical protein
MHRFKLLAKIGIYHDKVKAEALSSGNLAALNIFLHKQADLQALYA